MRILAIRADQEIGVPRIRDSSPRVEPRWSSSSLEQSSRRHSAQTPCPWRRVRYADALIPPGARSNYGRIRVAR